MAPCGATSKTRRKKGCPIPQQLPDVRGDLLMGATAASLSPLRPGSLYRIGKLNAYFGEEAAHECVRTPHCSEQVVEGQSSNA
eukprot:1050885-Lingulodinium_polyedra.AAC.1